MTDKLATDYAKGIALAFYDADTDAPFGYKSEDGEEADTLAEVLKAAGIKKKDRNDYDASNLPDGWTVVSAFDYLEGVLDFEYIVGADRSYKHANICIALGGPGAWISTEDATVTVYWGGKSTQSIPYAVAEALDEAMSELWENNA